MASAEDPVGSAWDGESFLGPLGRSQAIGASARAAEPSAPQEQALVSGPPAPADDAPAAPPMHRQLLAADGYPLIDPGPAGLLVTAGDLRANRVRVQPDPRYAEYAQQLATQRAKLVSWLASAERPPQAAAVQRDAARRPRQQTAPLPNPYTSSQRTLRAAAERGTRAARPIRKPATRKIGKGLGPNFSRPAADAGENEQPTDSSADEQPTAPAGWMPAGPRSTVAQAERPEHWSGTTGGYYRDGRPQVVASAKPDAEVMAAAEAQGLELYLNPASKSGYKGVYKHNAYWRAQLRRRTGAGNDDNTSLSCGETRGTPLEAALDYSRMLRDANA